MLLKIRTKFAKSFFSQRRPISSEVEIKQVLGAGQKQNKFKQLKSLPFMVFFKIVLKFISKLNQNNI